MEVQLNVGGRYELIAARIIAIQSRVDIVVGDRVVVIVGDHQVVLTAGGETFPIIGTGCGDGLEVDELLGRIVPSVEG